jgi:subtilisin-like proprotein convertase family protein
LSRPNSVPRLEAAAKEYFEKRDRQSKDNVDPEPPAGPKGFGMDDDQTLVPGFGTATVRFPYTKDNVAEAESILKRSDRNGDGAIDRAEAERSRWTETNPFEADLNRDGKITKMELIQRYAKRNVMELRRGQQYKSPEIYDNGEDNEWDWRDWRRRREEDRGSRYLASTIMERFDFDKDNSLDPAEMKAAGIEVGKADFDRDGLVSRDELGQFLGTEMETVANQLSDAIPNWFFERDVNGDRQLQMVEFTNDWDAEKLDEFSSYDTNQDGILTTDEMLSSTNIVGGEFGNSQAKVLLPRDTVISEIVVDQDYTIGDLNVQVSITHTHDDHLDGYLLGPDGEQTELFTGVGGSDDHFDRTIFDDEAGENIAKSRPPFRGNFQPEALLKKQPGLSRYNGQNLKGVWQLIIRSSRSDRAGVLHGWSLNVRPAKVDEYAAEE